MVLPPRGDGSVGSGSADWGKGRGDADLFPQQDAGEIFVEGSHQREEYFRGRGLSTEMFLSCCEA